MNEDKRRKWKSADKLRIVMAGMQKEVDVAELCRREGINPTQYYGWKKQLLGSASKVFENGAGGQGAAAGVGPAARQGCHRRDHGREPGAKKRALGLEDHGQLPAEL